MTDHRKIAVLTGMLFILATVSSLISYAGILDPILTRPDYLSSISENRNLVVTGVLFELVNNFAIVAIAIALYPVLKMHSVALALAYIVARTIESIVITIGDFSVLTLASLGQSFPGVNGQDAGAYEIVGGTLLAIVDWTFLLGPGVVLAISAVILNYILHRAELVPKFLTLWGFAGAILLFTGDMLAIYEYDQVLLFAAPIALQEMVFAVWLILKGFNTSAFSS